MINKFYLLILVISSLLYSQQSDSNYKYGVQFQLSEGYSTIGCIGFDAATSFNVTINKISVSPYIEYGIYTSFKTDVREINFTEWVAGTNTFYNIVNLRYFKIKTGTGISIAYINGIKEEWNGWYGEEHLEEEKINNISAAWNLIAGISLGNKIAIEIFPVYFSIGLWDKKYTPKIGLGYRF